MLCERFVELNDAVCERFVDRDSEVRSCVMSIVGGFNCFFLGEPGVAKSAVVNAVTETISDAKLFRLQMHAGTLPDEVFGPPKISALKKDRFERAVEGFLPSSNVAFLDEGFNASSFVLNALLEALNERTFTNGNVVERIPLSSVFVASNNIPVSVNGDLAALWDRLHFRHVVKPLVGDVQLRELLLLNDVEMPVVASWEDVLCAREECGSVVVDDRVVDRIVSLVLLLNENDVRLTARRVRMIPDVLRVHAWLRGCDVVEDEDFVCLSDVLWGSVDQIPVVRQLVGSYASTNPSTKTIGLLHKKFVDACKNVHKGDEDALCAANGVGVELMSELLNATRHGVGTVASRKNASQLIDECDRMFNAAYVRGRGSKTVRSLSQVVRDDS